MHNNNGEKKKKWREINIFHDIKEGEIESYYTNYYFINIMKKKKMTKFVFVNYKNLKN